MNVTLKLKSETHFHQKPVSEIGINSDGKIFFARSDDMLLIYDLSTGNKMKGFYDSAGYQAAAFAGDGRTLLYMSEDHIHYFDLPTWQERMLIFGELREFPEVDAHLDLGYWAEGDQSGAIKVYSIGADEDEPPKFILTGHSTYIEYLAFHPSGKILASSAGDRTIRFWDMETKKEISALEVPGEVVTALAFSPDGKIVVTGDYEGRVKVWEFEME